MYFYRMSLLTQLRNFFLNYHFSTKLIASNRLFSWVAMLSLSLHLILLWLLSKLFSCKTSKESYEFLDYACQVNLCMKKYLDQFLLIVWDNSNLVEWGMSNDNTQCPIRMCHTCHKKSCKKWRYLVSSCGLHT